MSEELHQECTDHRHPSWPDGMYLRGDTYWYRATPGTRAIKLGLIRIDASKKLEHIGRPKAQSPLLARRAAEISRIEKHLYYSMNKRAADAGLSCMSSDELCGLLARAAGHCELTGIKFSSKRIAGALKRPWAPSLDRMDRAKGYEAANCRIVCVAVNLALNEFGEGVLRRIARHLVK